MTPRHAVEDGGVSIMMPAYNAERYIKTSIESALAQTFTNWELVIVDDGSTDGTNDIAASFGDARIRIVRQPNQGESAARNTALDAVRGQYLAFLDADDLYLPAHLELVMARFRAQPALAGVFTDGIHITDEGKQLKPLSSRRREPKTGRVFDEVVFGSDFFGPPLCVVLRRDLIVRHGLTFDRGIVMGPDWDFFVRFSDLGPFDYVDEKTCLYRVHRKSITGSLGADRRMSERAKCRTSAIKLPQFATCAVPVRENAFYDLLIEALGGHPEQQMAVTAWPEFAELPGPSRAVLFRLLASEGMLLDYAPAIVREWLSRSRACDATDVRTLVLQLVHRVSPALCVRLVRRHRRGQLRLIDLPPFADLGFE